MYGIVVELPFIVPGLVATTDPVELTVVVEHQAALHDLSPAATFRQDDPDEPALREGVVGDEVVMVYDEVLSVAVDAAGGRVRCRRAAGLGDRAMGHLLLDIVIPSVLATRSHLVLHAAALVGPGGGAVLLAGPSGAGKSTTASLLSRCGWRVLSDDCARLTESDGGLRVHPGTAGLRLHPDSVTGLNLRVGEGRRVSEGSEKVVMPTAAVGALPASRSAPVERVVYLQPAPEAATLALHPMNAAELLPALAHQVFDLVPPAGRDAGELLMTLIGLATAIPVRRLVLPRRFDLGPDLAALLSHWG